jgi:hypothetical protein
VLSAANLFAAVPAVASAECFLRGVALGLARVGMQGSIKATRPCRQTDELGCLLAGVLYSFGSGLRPVPEVKQSFFVCRVEPLHLSVSKCHKGWRHVVD